jgi:hypothetical protein
MSKQIMNVCFSLLPVKASSCLNHFRYSYHPHRMHILDCNPLQLLNKPVFLRKSLCYLGWKYLGSGWTVHSSCREKIKSKVTDLIFICRPSFQYSAAWILDLSLNFLLLMLLDLEQITDSFIAKISSDINGDETFHNKCPKIYRY